MTSCTSFNQRNPYKGATLRCWVLLRFVISDGSIFEREMVADTGSPCAVILGEADLSLFSRATATSVNSNFGPLNGGWLEIEAPSQGMTTMVHGFGSDRVLHEVKSDCLDFAGIVGLPLLRRFVFGGDRSAFWLQSPT
jgi:hypothetical protein